MSAAEMAAEKHEEEVLDGTAADERSELADLSDAELLARFHQALADQ